MLSASMRFTRWRCALAGATTVHPVCARNTAPITTLLSSSIRMDIGSRPITVQVKRELAGCDNHTALKSAKSLGPDNLQEYSMAKFRTLDDIDVRGKRVLLRADLNVPVKDGVVADATRIERLAPTIETLIEKGAKVVVMSHFGRPNGGPDPALSLRALVVPLEKAIGGRHVAFAADCVGEEATRAVAALHPGQVALLENLRFHRGEEANSPDFARALAELGDIYVDDAFSAAHRAHASIAALAHLLPAAAGKLMEAELAALNAALENPARPVMALIGGAKVSTKLELLCFVIGKVDLLAIGGAMANTLLFAEGKEVGRSLTERDMAENARQLLALAREHNCRVLLPEDAVIAAELAPGTLTRAVQIDMVPGDMMILDIGPKTVARIAAALEGHAPSCGMARSAPLRHDLSTRQPWRWRKRSGS